jgi:hypothetical protein
MIGAALSQRYPCNGNKSLHSTRETHLLQLAVAVDVGFSIDYLGPASGRSRRVFPEDIQKLLFPDILGTGAGANEPRGNPLLETWLAVRSDRQRRMPQKTKCN